MIKNKIIFIVMISLITAALILSVASIVIGCIALQKGHGVSAIYGADELSLNAFFSDEITEMYYDGSIYFINETGTFYDEEILNELRNILSEGIFLTYEYKPKYKPGVIGAGPSPFIRFKSAAGTYTFAESSGECNYIGMINNDMEIDGFYSSNVRLRIDAVINKAKNIAKTNKPFGKM